MDNYEIRTANGKVVESCSFNEPNEASLYMVEVYGKMFSDNYFPEFEDSMQERLKLVRDCDGDIIWKQGDNSIGAGPNDKQYLSIWEII